MLCKLGLYTCLTPASSRGLSAGPPGSPSSSACSTGTCPLSILDAVFPWIGRFARQLVGRFARQLVGPFARQQVGPFARHLVGPFSRHLKDPFSRHLVGLICTSMLAKTLSWLQTVAMGLYNVQTAKRDGIYTVYSPSPYMCHFEAKFH